MSDINPSALGEQFDAEFQAKLNACESPEAIKTLMHERELAQHLRVPDAIDNTLLLPVETPQPCGYAKTLTINGVKHVIEGATETELAKAEVALYHNLFAQTTTMETKKARDSQGRLTADQGRSGEEAADAADSALEAGRQADLRGKMLRGEISVDEYTIQSGALDRALQEAGIDATALREVSHHRYEQRWASATDEFLKSSDWPGGTDNMKRLGETLIAMNGTHDPSVDSLRRAYQFMKDKNMIVENPETVQAQRIANAKTPAELRDAVGYKSTTGLWGR